MASAINWLRAVNDKARVRLRWAIRDSPGVRGTGRVVAYCDAPMVCVLTDAGERIWWRADLVERIHLGDNRD